jgi:hypothetical protein
MANVTRAMRLSPTGDKPRHAFDPRVAAKIAPMFPALPAKSKGLGGALPRRLPARARAPLGLGVAPLKHLLEKVRVI